MIKSEEEMVKRVQDAGFQIRYVPMVIVYDITSPTYDSFRSYTLEDLYSFYNKIYSEIPL